MTIAVIIYPVGMIMTNPDAVNTILDNSNLEKITLKIFSDITLIQLTNSTPNSSQADLSKAISDNLVDEAALKAQRQKAVISFYQSVENGEVPTVRLDVMNPLAKAQSYLNEATGSFTQKITDFFNTLLGKEPEKRQDSTGIDQNTFIIETSLGITKDNIEKTSLIFRILKYGPQMLLIVGAALLAIGYITTLPSTKFAWEVIMLSIKISITSIVTWVISPFLFNIINPNIIPFVDAETKADINHLIGNILFELAKSSIIVPIIMLLVTTLIWILIILYNRVKDAGNGFGRYEEKENQSNRVSESERSDGEDELEGEDDSEYGVVDINDNRKPINKQ
jgi:hypothetical protein